MIAGAVIAQGKGLEHPTPVAFTAEPRLQRALHALSSSLTEARKRASFLCPALQRHLHTHLPCHRATTDMWSGSIHHQSTPSRLCDRVWSIFGWKHRASNPVFSSFKVSTCLWLEPPPDEEAAGDFSQSLVNFLSKRTAWQRAFIQRFHRETRSSYRRKEVHELQRAPNILLHRSLTRQLFGSFPRHIDIYRRIKVLIWLSSGKSHVWHFHRVFTPRCPSPEPRDPKKGKRNNLKYNRDP